MKFSLIMHEFSLIEHFFKPLSIQRQDVVFGIGDDAACLRIPAGQDLLVSTDTLVSQVHFLPEWDAYDNAYKAVMVNLSDMAAMAALPCWLTLALTLPEQDQHWLTRFSQGLNAALREYQVDLIGGDTTKGPLSMTITVMGLAPQGRAIRRNGAKPGDFIMISGILGAAALAIKLLDNQDVSVQDREILMQKLLHPKPRVDLIRILQDYATAAIDISDGLSADLNHVCVASGVGACLDADAIPLHPLVKQYWKQQALDLALGGGEDYELCFTIPPERFAAFQTAVQAADIVCYRIGVIEETQGLRVKSTDNSVKSLQPVGYTHF